jgi:catechol 2,3-dioxygenase-like lactoylglutathione lyase family enzyme
MKLFSLTLLLALGCAAPLAQEGRDKPAKEAPKAAAPAKSPIAYDGTIMPAFHVRSLEAAKKWYRDVLGFEVVYELAEQGWCEVATPVKEAKLGLSENPAGEKSGDAFVSFGVQDMAKAKAHLVASKVVLENDVIEIPGVVKLLYFEDPDGNKLMFYEPAKQAKPAK